MSKPYRVQDHYFKKAKEEGFRARSAYKLIQIQEKFRVFKRGQTVLDLGAAPGSFVQAISDWVGDSGTVIGVDNQEMDPVDRANVKLVQADIYDEALLSTLKSWTPKGFDVISSDLAPKTTGIRDLDQGLSLELTEQAFEIAKELLKKGGHFVAKVFESQEMHGFLKDLKPHFEKVQSYKPKATRERSKETYIVALNFKAARLSA